MVYELTFAVGIIASFIWGGVYQLIYKGVKKEQKEILRKIEENMNKLLEDSKNLIKTNKGNFIRDLAGLYHLESKIKRIGRDMRGVFFAFIAILIGVFVFEISGGVILVLIILFFVWEVGILWLLSSFFSMNKTLWFIEEFNKGVPPRDFVKKMKFGI